MARPERDSIDARYAGIEAVDEGLRTFMLRVYNYMSAGLAITGVAAFMIYNLALPGEGETPAALLKNGVALNAFGVSIYLSWMRYVIMFAPLVMVFLVMGNLRNMSVQGAQLAFWSFAALMGLSISSIFIVYTGASIVRVFFITSAAFGALSLYGYTTRRDLSPFYSFLIMGVVGLILASIVNLFIGWSVLQMAISAIGVLVFAGLTAVDTQQIKESYYDGDGDVVAGKKAIMGALRLYLDFINMFLMLLHLFGGSRE
ncbi:MAG: Bax inhibitor-1/YccA family protein [Alphaproteobacteria bacterium]